MPQDKNKVIDLDKIEVPEVKTIPGTIIDLDEPTGINTEGSRYDTGFVLPTENTEEALNEHRAQRQTALDKVANGTVKMLGTAVQSAVEPFTTLTLGVGEALAKGELNSLYDNPASRGLDSMNTFLKEKFPNYYSKAEQDYNILQGLGTVNFWADKVGNGVGFMAGAIASGMVTGAGTTKLLSSMSKLAIGESLGQTIAAGETAANVLEDLNRASKLVRLTDNGSQAIAGLTGAIGESGMEARQIKDLTLQNLREQRDSGLNNLTDKEIEDQANAAGNIGFGLNLAIVGSSNIIQFGKLFTGAANNEVKAFNKIVKNSKGEFISESGLPGIVKALESPFVESTQEQLQQAIQSGVQNYYERKNDRTAKKDVNNLLEATIYGLSQAYGTKEGWEQGVIGAILGGAGSLATLSKTKQIEAQKEANTQGLIEALNKYKLSDSFKPLYEAAVRHTSFENTKQIALKNNDLFAYQNAHTGQFFSYIQSRIDANKFESVLDDLNQVKNLSEEQFKKDFGFDESLPLPKPVHQFVNDLILKAKEVSRLSESIDNKFPNIHPDIKQQLKYTAYGISDIDNRESSLSSKLALLTKGKIAYNAERYADKENYKEKLSDRLDQVKINPADKQEVEGILEDLGKLSTRRESFIEAYNKLSDPKFQKDEQERIEKIAKKEEEESRKQEETKSTSPTSTENQPTSEIIPELTIESLVNKIVKDGGTQTLTTEEEQFRQNHNEAIETELKKPKEIVEEEIEIPLASQNEQKTLTTTQINEDPNIINTQSRPEEYFDLGHRGKRKISPFTMDAGPDNGSDPSADRYYRFVNNNFVPFAKNLVVTKKNNPKLFNEILELDTNAKEFVKNNPEHEGIWIVLGDENGKPVKANKQGILDKDGDIVFATVTTIEALGDRIIEKYPGTLPILKQQLEYFRKKALESTESFYVQTINKSQGHAVYEKTIEGIRQSHPVIGRIANKLENIALELPTLAVEGKPTMSFISNGQIATTGKLYAINKDGNSVDLIPRLLNEQEQDKVFHLILQKLGVEERKSYNISEELNKLIYFGLKKGEAPTDFTLSQVWSPAGYEKSTIFIGKERVNKNILSTEEGQTKLREFLKSKRVNVNSKYGFEDRFTDIFGKEHDSYKQYLLEGESPLFGTDLVKNTEVQYRNQYFTYDPTIKEKEIKETKEIKDIEKRRQEELRVEGKLVYETGKDSKGNSYNSWIDHEAAVNKKYDKELQKLTKSEKIKFQKKTPKDLDKLRVLEVNNSPLSKEEQDWFKSNFPNIPVEVVKGLIENKSFGRFLSAGKILLSDEAIFGTLYHEAFHVISQMYLSQKELSALYKETKEKTGAKTDLEAEEKLAEEFIEYKKSGKVIGGRYQRNDLFRKILNFIKDLLRIPVNSIEDIYRRIDKGYYKNKPTIQSVQYKSLDRSKVSEDKGVIFENEVLSNIGALYYDELFKGNKTPNEITTNISNILADRIFNNIVDQYETEQGLGKSANLQYILENWNEIIETFRLKSKANGIEIKIVPDNESEDISVEDEENKTSNDTAYQEANLVSTKATMNDSIWTLVTSLKQKNKDGSDKISELTGLPLSINPTQTYNFLLKQLAGLSTFEDIYNKIDKLADTRPELIDLLEKLGQPSSSNSYAQQLFQNQFRQDFGKNRMTSHKTILKSDGTVYVVDANNENNAGRILEKWQNNLLSTTPVTKEGKIILDLDKVQFGNPEVFLQSIGLKLSPETIQQSKEEDKFIPAVVAIQNYIRKNKGDITTLFTPTKEEKEAKTDVKGNIQYLTQLEADFNPDSAELSFMSTEGKTVYSVGYNNALSIVKNTINNSNTKEELFTKLPHLNTISTEGSVYLAELFDSNGNKRKDRYLEVNLHDGLATDAETETSYKASTRKLSAGDKWVQEINSILLDGRSSYIRASDKSSEHTIYMNKYGKGQKLYIPIEDLKSLDNKRLKSTFQGYFTSELKRIALHKVLNFGNDLDIFDKQGGKFSVFEDILSGETKKAINEYIETLKQQDLSQEELLQQIDTIAPTFSQKVSDDTEVFFVKYSEQIRNELKELKISKSQGISKDFEKYSLEQLTNTIAVNDFINSIEQTKLFTGDMVFYKDLFKRTAAMVGTKQTAANSDSINSWLNNNFTRVDGKVENGEITSLVFEDVTQGLQTELLDSYINTLVESGMSQEQAQTILDPYNKMDEGDAQGGISLDEYRSFFTRLGKEIPQDVFEKAQKGEALNADEMHYFTVIKAQYAGPQKYNTIFAPAYHKYSLLPILPRMIKGKNLDTILNNMTKHQVGYFLFKSGSKVGTRVTNGKANKFYTDTNNGTINTENWQKQTIFYDFLGLQTETSEPHNTVIFGTQFRKLLFSNQFESGNEIIKGSKELLDKYNSIIDSLVQKEKSKLIEELGINPETYKSEDVSKIVNLLQEEAKNRNLADNLIDGLQSEIVEGNLLLKYKFDAMVTKNKIDSMLMSLINSRLIRQKITGDALIQVSSSGFEEKGNRKAGTNSVLQSYRKDPETGKTLAAEVIVPLDLKVYGHLLEKYGTLEDINLAIKDQKIDKKDLQLVGYRIPTQGFNSMEFFEIAEFLPTESSTSIVVPTTIVAKSGSDFDVDKLNIIKRSDKSSELMDIAVDILSHPDNFVALITPNSSSILKNVANEIRFIEHLNEKPDTDLIRDKFETQEAYEKAYNEKKDTYIAAREQGLKSNIRYTNQLKLSGKEGKIAQFTKFMTAKDMIGIAAIQNTHNILAQTHDLTIDGKQVVINLPINKLESGDISLAKQKDVENRHQISEIISQVLTASVDAAKDPFMFDINLTMETLGTALYLVRIGVPFETVGYFLAQPIITDYLKELSINKSGFLKATNNSEFKNKLIGKVKDSYGKLPQDYQKITFSESKLKDNLSKLGQTSNKDFNKEQLQILDDYLAYQEQSQLLSDAIRATNMDTAGVGKNLNTIQAKLDLIEKVKSDGFVKGIEKILDNSIVKTFNQLEFTQKAYSQFYYTQTEEFKKVKQDLLKEIDPFGDSAKDKLATLIENDLINFIVQNFGYPNITELRSKLFRTDSIAKKLLNLKNKKDKNVDEQKIVDNLLIKELQPLLSTKKKDDNNIRMYTKRLDTFTSNQLTEAFRDLKELDPSLAKEIMDLGILQSGLNNSPITYLGTIPFEYYNDLVKRAFENYEAKKNGAELEQFKSLFLDNNGYYYDSKERLKQGKPKLGSGMYGKIYIPQKPQTPTEETDSELDEPQFKKEFIPNLQMYPDNIKKIEEGSKTTTTRSEAQAKIINIPVGETEIRLIGNKKYSVTNRGLLTIEEAGGREAIEKSENFENNIPKFQQTKDWLSGKGKLYVYDIKSEEPSFLKTDTRINEELRKSVISRFHNTKEQAETALREIKDLLLGSYIHPVGDKWKVYAPVQKERSNQFPQQSKGETRSKEDIITKEEGFRVLKDFTERLGVKGQFITKEKAKELLDDKWEDSIKAFYHQGEVYLTNLNLDDVIHEFSHPFVEKLAEQNPELFDSVMDQVIKEFPEISELVNELYPEDYKKGIVPSLKAKKEIAVRALTKLAKEEYKTPEQKSILEKLWEAIKSILGLNKTDLSKLSPNTTLRELATIIAKESIDVSQQESETEFKKVKTEEEKKQFKESAFKEQHIFFQRRINELKKQQKEYKEGTPQYNKIQEEIDTIEPKLTQASVEQNEQIYLDLGNQTLDKVDTYIDRLSKGEALTDKNIEFVADVIEAFRDFPELETRTAKLERELAPIIQDYTRKIVQEHATEQEPITQEKIDSQTTDIGKFQKGVGSLSDLVNYIGRTIGSVIKTAQNKVSTRNKKLTSDIQTEVNSLEAWGKKNGVPLDRVYNIFIQPHKGSTRLTQQYYESGNENPNWKRIQNTPELKRFYDFYQETIEKAQENLPIQLGRNFIPNIRKSTLKNKLKSLVPVHTFEEGQFVGNEDLFADVLQTEYTKKLSEEEKSRDLGASLLQFAAYANNYEEMSAIIPTVRILQRALTTKINSKGQVIDRTFTKSSDPGKEIKGQDSNVYKMTEDYINMQVFSSMKFAEGKIKIGNLYDENGKPIGEKYILGSDIADVALKYNSLLRIGFSPVTAAANWLFGDVTNLIEAVGGRFFTTSGLVQASNIFMKQNFNKESVLNKLLEELNPLQELDDYDQINKVSLKGKMSAEKLQEYAYSMQKSGEKWLQSRTMLAVMIKDGYLTSSGELTEKYNKASEQEKQQLTDKVQRLNQMIHGRYTTRESATLSQSVLYRLASQFKKWIPSYIESHFDKLHYDNRLQTEIEGRFRTLGRLAVDLKDTINRIKEGKLTESEIYNLKKNVIEITLMAATALLFAGLHGDDDKDRKRRQQWTVKTGLTLLNRVSGDIAFFYSPGQIAHTVKNLVPLVTTLDDLRLAISYIPQAFDHKKGVYKSGSHKGQNKFLTKLANVTVGVKPLGDIRRLSNKMELEELR